MYLPPERPEGVSEKEWQIAVLVNNGDPQKFIDFLNQDNNLDLKNLEGVLITHEHTDHIAGLNVLLKNTDTQTKQISQKKSSNIIKIILLLLSSFAI